MRQPLTAIVSNGVAAQNYMKRTPPAIEDVRNLVEQMIQSGYRASAVLDNIRALFKPDDQTDSQSIGINELISEGLQILRGELDSHGIAVRAILDPGLPSIVGHKGQLQEVILNLVQNSIDAVKMTEGRKRLIQVQTEKLDQKMVAISVSDSGAGIDPGRITNIFEAFATTKADGMGLGLAISQMIIERHGGEIFASTSPGGGVRVEIKLPIAPDTIS
jgi:signal transduction histidine kinase